MGPVRTSSYSAAAQDQWARPEERRAAEGHWKSGRQGKNQTASTCAARASISMPVRPERAAPQRRSPQQHPDRGGVAPTPPPSPGIRARTRAPPARARPSPPHCTPHAGRARAHRQVHRLRGRIPGHMGCPSVPPSNSNPHAARIIGQQRSIPLHHYWRRRVPALSTIHHALPLHYCCRF